MNQIKLIVSYRFLSSILIYHINISIIICIYNEYMTNQADIWLKNCLGKFPNYPILLGMYACFVISQYIYLHIIFNIFQNIWTCEMSFARF